MQGRTAISGVLGLEDPAGHTGRRTGTYYVGGARLRLASPLACALVRTCNALEDVRHRADHATLRGLRTYVTKTRRRVKGRTMSPRA